MNLERKKLRVKSSHMDWSVKKRYDARMNKAHTRKITLPLFMGLCFVLSGCGEESAAGNASAENIPDVSGIADTFPGENQVSDAVERKSEGGSSTGNGDVNSPEETSSNDASTETIMTCH